MSSVDPVATELLNEWKPEVVTFDYVNYRGEPGKRRVLPSRIYFGKTQWHPENQWLLAGLDLDKGEQRDFAMNNITNWKAGHLL